MANARLQITDLDFNTIKTNLKAFLKQQSEFQDYDFEGSSLSILMDLLAYNTHYNAYYLNMVANEAFLDTALLRDSVVSHAKTLGYTPFSISAPSATINLTVETASTTPAIATLPRGFSFSSNLIDDISYRFVTIDSVTATKSNTQFIFENLKIYEGEIVNYAFSYTKASNPKSVFILPDPNVDTNTLLVTVSDNTGNTATEIYNRVVDILDVESTSNVYFLREGRNGNFEISFGDNVIGKKLVDGATVTISYLITQGDVANKANGFIPDSPIEGFSQFDVVVLGVASGGTARESVDSIKFSAQAQYATQNRLITFKDYETYIQANYPNIDSLSVWGGEENIPPVYGRVYIALKPKDNYFISETEKKRILEEIVNPKSIVSVTAEIRDPEFLYLLIDVKAEYNSNKTTSTETILKEKIRTAILSYRNTYLNKFASKIINSKIEADIDSVDLNAIVGNKIITRVQKRFEPELNTRQSYTVNFNVPINRGTVTNKITSTEFDVIDSDGIRRTVFFDEVPQSFTGISNIEVTNPGSGYLSAPTVTITGDGTGATAQATIVNGAIQSISVTSRGIDYTRAIVTISGGNGFGGEASAIIDAATGTLRTIYYDSNAQRQIVNSLAGEINYNVGTVTIFDINMLSVSSPDNLIRLSFEAEEGIIESARNTIITIDESDPVAITVNLTKVA